MRDSIKTENELTTNIDRLIFKKIPTKKINDTETDFQLTVNPEPEKYMYPKFAKAETDYLVQEFKRYTIHNIEIKRTAEAILVNYFKPVEFEQLLNHSFDNIKKSNPYLSRTDFINDYLGQTLFYLELILSDLNDPNNDDFHPFSTDFFEINKPSTYFIFIVHKYPLDYNSESLFYYFKKIKSIIQGTAYFETIIQKEKTPPSEPTKSEILKPKLLEYKFHELEKVKTLTEENRNILIDEIATSQLPYKIALLDCLGFLDYLRENYFKTENKLRDGLVKILDAENRAIKGNISVLNPISKENRNRYTAHTHKEKVIKDYEKLI